MSEQGPRALSEAEILDLVNAGYEALPVDLRRLFDAIRVDAERWELRPWGDAFGGFWVVAVFGKRALFYNEIEGGFNRSRWVHFGVLEDYLCNQDELSHAMVVVRRILDSGMDGSMAVGPPHPLE